MQSARDALAQLTPEQLAFRHFPSYIALQNPNYRFSQHNLILASVLERVESGEIRRLIVDMPPRHGKGCADKTSIYTTSGRRFHGDLRVGDFVFGPDGKPTKVLFRSGELICDTEVELTNGEIIKVNPEHLWTVYDRKSYPQIKRTLETQELSKDFWIGENGKRGGRARWQLPDIKALEYPEDELPMHPYALGAWLGDGNSKKALIAHGFSDNEVINGIESCGYKINKQWIQKETGVAYTSFGSGKRFINSKFANDLRAAGVFNNKHIPEIYLRSSINQRLELLAGLIDTDGSVESKTGRVRFSTCSETLRDDVFDLAAGLAFRPYITSTQPSTSSSGIVGKKIVYQVCFQPNRQIPTRIPRKQLKNFAVRRRIAIKDIRPAKIAEIGHCIKVDREDGLYLVGRQLATTHNTMQIGEYFIPWFIGRNPAFQSVYSTYAFERAGDVGRKVRNQMLDSVYQRVFPESNLSKDSRGINRLSTDSGGNFYAVGVGGIIVGRGAHLFVIDDPHKNRQDVESETQRNKIISWFRSAAYTRMMPDKADSDETLLGRIVVVMTRWHFSDLAGFIVEELKHEPWHILRMPAICDSNDDIMGRKPGEALWPSHYPIEVLENIRETIGTVEWNAQYQQSPLPSEGGMVKLEWFSRYDYGPWAAIEFVLNQSNNDHVIARENIPYGINRIVISADTAYKEKQLNDPSAFTIWGVTAKNEFYLLKSIAERMVYPTLKKMTIDLWKRYSRVATGQPVIVLIEDKGSGTSLIQELKMMNFIEKNLPRVMPVVPIPAVTSKQIRMSTASPLIEAGRVFLPTKSPWLVPYETQVCRFPLWKEDDLVDSTSQFLNWAGAPIYVSTGLRYWK